MISFFSDEFGFIFNEEIKALKYELFDEIVTPYYAGKVKKLINEISYNYIIIVDEGSETYVEFKKRNYGSKVTDVYLFNPSLLLDLKDIDWLKIHSININIYYETLSKIEKDLILKENSVVVLSSSSWFDNAKQGYNKKDIDLINKLISKDYNVYYKVHPRNYLKDNDSLINTINNDKFFMIDPSKNLLIETILFNNKDKIEFIVGELSSTLYQSYNVFEIPAFSTLDEDSHWEQYIIMFKYLPRFQEFLLSNLSSKEFYIKSMKYLNFVRDRFDILHNLILSKDNVIKDKDNVIKDKDNVIKDKDNIIKIMKEIMKIKETIINKINNLIK